MGSFHLHSAQGLRVVPLLAACLLLTSPAVAQEGKNSGELVSLSAKEAVRLIMRQENPDYPPLARLNYIQGHVRVEVTVGEDGNVSEAHVVKGHPFLAASALSSIRHWVYRPFRIAAKSVMFKTLVDVNFTLRASLVGRLPPSAERDLQARVTPPELLEDQAAPTEDHVRMRVLVGADGHPLDMRPLSGEAQDIHEATQAVLHWSFRPAYWGTMAVPWYKVVDVPVHHLSSSPQPSADPGTI